MARLQILELPEGTNDDRSPFVLVVDQVPRDEPAFEALRRDLEDNDIAARIGAQGVLVFEKTVDIPTNEPPPLAEADDPERTGTTQLVYAHERSRLALCDALLLPRDTTWHKLTQKAAERQRDAAALCRRLDRVCELPERPETMAVNPEEPHTYMDGYAAGIRAAKRAVETGG